MSSVADKLYSVFEPSVTTYNCIYSRQANASLAEYDSILHSILIIIIVSIIIFPPQPQLKQEQGRAKTNSGESKNEKVKKGKKGRMKKKDNLRLPQFARSTVCKSVPMDLGFLFLIANCRL